MTRELGPDGLAKGEGQLLVSGALPQQRAHGDLSVREQAIAQGTVCRQPEAVAGAAKGLGHAGDQSDLAASVLESEALRRRTAARFDRHERPDPVDPVEHLSTGDQAIPPPCSVRVERHELDEPDHPSRTAGEVGERKDLVIVLTTQEHDVDFERSQSCLLGRVHGTEDSGQLPPAADGTKPVGAQGITADVDPSEPSRSQFLRHARQLHAIGGQGQVVKSDSTEPGDEAGQTSSDKRLAAGDADAGHTALTCHPGQPGDLIEREQIVTRHGW